ncbi:MAG: outer membrane protein assembly factor BamA [Pseudomonadota bacterium]
MIKRLIPLLVAAVCLFPTRTPAAAVPQVLVLPLTVFSSQPASAETERIDVALKNQLKREGAQILPLPGDIKDAAAGQSQWTLKSLQEVGIRAGADYVIWGSLSWFGRQLSLDLKMMRPTGQTDAPWSYYVEGAGIDPLIGALRRVGSRISMRVLDRQLIADIRIEGNQRIEADAIKRVVRAKPGDVLRQKDIVRDMRKVYEMGYFEDVRVETDEGADGLDVIFVLKENPTIRRVTFTGNKEFDEKELMENLTVKTGTVLNNDRIRVNVQRIEGLYKEKNYHNVVVSYKATPRDANNQVDVAFEIQEGNELKITKISFEGNKTYTAGKLQKLIETSEKGIFSFITSSGELKPDELEQDSSRISAFYQNNGFIEAKVGEPVVDFQEKGIHVTFKIVEGERFKVGNVDISGDMVVPKALLLARLQIGAEPYFSRERLRNDVLALTDSVSDEGYAYANVMPQISEDREKLLVDVVYTIDKGQQVYFEKIIINGNSKTRDKVIRRELRVYEQELYSGRRLKAGVGSLYRLDFFEDIKVDTPKGSADDKMLLKIDVTEKQTGAFSFGGGYSSTESLFGTVSVSQRNLFGRGQLLNLSATLGGRSTQYRLGLTEPWLFDIPLSAGFEVYAWDYEYDTYTKKSLGGTLSSSYPVWNYTRLYGSYSYDQTEIADVDITAADSIKELKGLLSNSSISSTLRYDSTNSRFNATRGNNSSATVQYAGLGGDIGFTKVVLETGWYHPLFWRFTGFAHGKTGIVWKHDDKILPDYDKFYLGGINSLRGFTYEDLSPVVTNSLGLQSYVGGEKFVQVNLEILFPLLEDAGVVGLVFFDTGDLYSADQDIALGNLRESIGAGVRWYSPMGPIRLEYGHILDPEPGGSEGGRWEFAMGTAF